MTTMAVSEFKARALPTRVQRLLDYPDVRTVW